MLAFTPKPSATMADRKCSPAASDASDCNATLPAEALGLSAGSGFQATFATVLTDASRALPRALRRGCTRRTTGGVGSIMAARGMRRGSTLDAPSSAATPAT